MIGMGTALIGAGTVIGATGALALKFFNDATDSAIAYNQQVALTKTQVDNAKISLAQLRDLGLDIANRFPVQFDSVQKALYDIFSTMDVSLPQARKLMEAFAKASVGGQVDIQQAGRTTMQIMNAFKIPVGDVTKVLDVQFQLVRKGVGTYEEFNSTIGRAIPSAARAGQSFQTLAGMLAFLTRNGLSTAMASASAARALDAMANPTVANRLQKMGINVKDMHGNFKPLVDVLGEMNQKFAGLTKPELAAKLQDLFKGAGGTIQARRFFDLVFQNFDEFKQRVGEMQGASGQASQAFNQMMGTEASKAQLLQNRYQAMKVTIGQQLIPAKLRLMEIASKILDFWNRLSPKTQNLIVKIAALAAVIMVVVGVVLVAVGTFLLLDGMLALLGIGFGTLAAAIGIAIVVIAAIVLAIILVIKYHKQIAEAAKIAWKYIAEAAKNAWENYIYPAVSAIVDFFTGPFMDAFNTAKDAVVTAVQFMIQQVLSFASWVNTYVMPVVKALGDLFSAVWDQITQATSIALDIIMPLVEGAWNVLLVMTQTTWNLIYTVMSTALKIMVSDLQIALAFIMAIWRPVWNEIKTILLTAWNIMRTIVESALMVIKGIIQIVTGIIRGDWSQVWNGIKSILEGVWHGIQGTVNAAVHLLKDTISNTIDGILNIFRTMPGKILSALGDLGSLLINAGEEIIKGLIKGIQNMAGGIGDAITGAISGALDHVPGGGFLKKAWHLLAEGGIFTRATPAIIGEAGPEIVLPLRNARRMQELLNAATRRGLMPHVPTVTSHLVPARTATPVGTSRSVTIAPGAVQLIVQGSLDSATLPQVKKMLDDFTEDLTRRLN